MSTVHQTACAVYETVMPTHRVAAPPFPFRSWPPVAGSVAGLVRQLRQRGVRIYPDLDGGVGVISHGIDYGDLRAQLAARKAEVVAYLESELWSQRLLELMAFYGGDEARMRAVWLDRLARHGTRHHWDEARIEAMIARARDVARTQPEVLVTIGYSTQLVVWYPLMEEVAEHLAALGATEPEIVRALRTNNAHHVLEYTDEEIAAIARRALGAVSVPAPPTAGPSPPTRAQPAPAMSRGLLAFAETHGYACAYCGRSGDAAGDPDGAAWHRDLVEGTAHRGGRLSTSMRLACSVCKARPDRRPQIKDGAGSDGG